MKIKQFLFVPLIASMTKNKQSLVQPAGQLSRASYKTTAIRELPSKAKMVKPEGGGWALKAICKECIHFRDSADFETWLSSNCETETAIWIKMAKKSSGIPSITYKEALLVALCYGWIDGVKKSLDETYFLQRFTPRRSKSNWSLVNKNFAADLIASGLMQQSGLKAINEAKKDGRWIRNC